MQNFDETWGPLHSHEAPTQLSKASQFSLEQLQMTKRERLKGWLADLVEGTSTAKEVHVDTWLSRRYELIEAAAFRWIDALFDELNVFVREFNNSDSSQQSPLVLSSPKRTIELPCRRDPSSVPYKFSCYEGHITSHNFALLIRSYYETIQVYLIPCEMLFAVESDLLSNEVKPLIELTAVVNGESVCWTSTGLHLAPESISAIARELFSDLLRLTLNVIDVSDLFQSDQNSKPLSTQLGSEKQQAIGFIKDLHLWQTGAIFSKAITRDQDALANLPPETNDKFAPGALAKLKSQYDNLKNELVELSASIASMTSS